MKPRLQPGITIPSYLTSRPSRDLIIAGHQQITRDWRGVEAIFKFLSRSSYWTKQEPRILEPHVNGCSSFNIYCYWISRLR